MKHILFVLMASLCAIGFGHAVYAADLPTKGSVTPVPAAAPLSWTGFYAGGNLGYGWADPRTDFSGLEFNAADPIRTSGSYSTKINGLLGGLQMGYNLQLSNWLVGVETDLQVAEENGSSTFNGIINSVVNGVPNNIQPAPTTGHAQIDWFGTTRARLGFVWDRWLVYATGGLAYGRISISGSTASSSFLGPNPAWTFSGTATNTGWTVGGGVEMLLNSNWSAKVEYLYMNLGDVTAVGIIPSGGCYGTPGAGICAGAVVDPGSMAARSNNFINNVVRVGINYRFN